MKQDKTAVINDIHIQYAFKGDDKTIRNNVSFVIVNFEMPKWVTTVKRGLRKTWMYDKLLKVKTLKDRQQETFKERTIIIQNLPSHISPEELSDNLSTFGAITSIEAPTIDNYVQAQLEEKGLANDHYSKQRQMKKDQEYRYAQIILAENTQVDK